MVWNEHLPSHSFCESAAVWKPWWGAGGMSGSDAGSLHGCSQDVRWSCLVLRLNWWWKLCFQIHSLAVGQCFQFQLPETSVPHYVALSQVLLQCPYDMVGDFQRKSRKFPFLFFSLSFSLFLSQSIPGQRWAADLQLHCHNKWWHRYLKPWQTVCLARGPM